MPIIKSKTARNQPPRAPWGPRKTALILAVLGVVAVAAACESSGGG